MGRFAWSTASVLSRRKTPTVGVPSGWAVGPMVIHGNCSPWVGVPGDQWWMALLKSALRSGGWAARTW
ncbi:hypothetical protein ACH4C6_29510 [Streptomyces sp. NPDC017943]|uniref:hypothetical protein n=1 Tax=Streptomyces sp. NPDC017943 TaxID=3365019 RepID=UPI00378CA736